MAARPRNSGGGQRQEFRKPPLRLQTTTLWEYPSQHYGEGMQGDQRYAGATPSYVIWNLIQRYSQPGELIVDPMVGSGTTLDVARDTGRVARGFDLVSRRPDIEVADARKLPLQKNSVRLVFCDPPYSDHLNYSDEPGCLGRLSAYEPRYFEEMGRVVKECHRVLVPGGHLGLYCCDFYQKRRGLAPVGFGLFAELAALFEPVDIVAVVRHNRKLERGNYHQAAEQQNFFLRGFNYLLIGRKPG